MVGLSNYANTFRHGFPFRALCFGFLAIRILGSLSWLETVLIVTAVSIDSQAETSFNVSAILAKQQLLNPCLQRVISALSTLSEDGNSKDGCLLRNTELQKVVNNLAADQRCSAETSSSVLWLQYPAWFNGILLHAAAMSATTTRLSTVRRLPRPSDLPDQASMHSALSRLEDQTTSTVTFTTADASGVALDDLLALDENGNGYEHLIENACADRMVPTGPLYPRAFLLMWYRADALADLGNNYPPDHWEGLLDLLAAHARNVNTMGSSLPRYGLCITDSPHCGRVGDIVAAVAASVLQSRGTSQGYVFNLNAAAPGIEPLVNTAGWRYAADLVRQLLTYNAPDNDTEILTESIAPDLEEVLDCHAVSTYFTEGSCMVTMEWDAALPYIASAAPLQQTGVLGVAPLPGSQWVAASSADGDLGFCSATTCRVSLAHEMLYSPYGIYVNGQAHPRANEYSDVDISKTSSPSKAFQKMELKAMAAASGPATEALQRRPSLLVNRAPYSAFYGVQSRVQFAGAAMRVNTSSLPHAAGLNKLLEFHTLRQGIIDAVRATMGVFPSSASHAPNCTAYEGIAWWTALWPGTASSSSSIAAATHGPVDPDQLQPLPPAFNLSELLKLGLSEYAARSYLRSLWFVLHHPNAAPDVQAPLLLNWYRWALGYAGSMLMPVGGFNATAAETTAMSNASENRVDGTPVAPRVPASTEANSFLQDIYGRCLELMGSSAIHTAYARSISADDIVEDAIDSEMAPHTDKSAGLSPGVLAGAIVSPQVGVLAMVAAAAALTWLHRRNAQRHRDLLGRVRAPRSGPDTTLLITDVQNSTGLWEALPASTMDCALQIHNTCLRQALAKCDGYESATEGDSFIMAFTSPAAAAVFAASCQLALLEADWPPELLEHRDGAMVVVDQRDTTVLTGTSPTPPPPGSAPRSGAVPAMSVTAAGASQLPQLQASDAGPTVGAQQPSVLTQPVGWWSGRSGLLRWSTALPMNNSRRCRSSSQVQLPGGNAQNRRPSWSYVQNILTSMAFSHSGVRPASSTVSGPGGNPNPNPNLNPNPVVSGPRSLGPCPHVMLPVPSLQPQALSSHPQSPLLPQQLALLRRPASARGAPSATASHGPRTTTSRTSSGMAGGDTPRVLVCHDAFSPASPAAAILAGRTSVNGGGVAASGIARSNSRSVRTGLPATQHEDHRDAPTHLLPPKLLDDVEPAGATAALPIEAAVTTSPPAKLRSRLEALQQDSGDDLMMRSGTASFNNANSTNLDSSASDSGGLCTWQDLLAATFPVVLQPVVGTGTANATEMAATHFKRDLDQACVRLLDGRIVAFRGLRVRMGFHSGLDNPSHVSFNRVSSSYQYSGDFAEVARLVSESAPGGLVVMSGPAFARLRHCVEQGGLGAGGSAGGGSREALAMKHIRVVYAGHHVLKAAGDVSVESPVMGPSSITNSCAHGCGSNGAAASNDGFCSDVCRAGGHGHQMPRPLTLSPLGPKPPARTFTPDATGWYEHAFGKDPTRPDENCTCGVTLTAPGRVSVSFAMEDGGNRRGCGGTVTAATAATVATVATATSSSGLLITRSLPLDVQKVPQLIGAADACAAAAQEDLDPRIVRSTASILMPLAAPPPTFPYPPELESRTSHKCSQSTPYQTTPAQQEMDEVGGPNALERLETPPAAHHNSLSRWLAPQPLLPGPSPSQPAPPQPADTQAVRAASHSKSLSWCLWSRRLKRLILPRQGHRNTHTGLDATRHALPPTRPQPLYLAVPSGLLCRLALLPPIRSHWVSQLSSLDAPTGLITVAFLKVVGASTLLAELPGRVAVDALQQCQRFVVELLGAAGGYLVEGCGDGLVLAAFCAPTAAVEWALECVEGLKRVDWDPALLFHELCAECVEPAAATFVKHSPQQPTSMRGGPMAAAGGGHASAAGADGLMSNATGLPGSMSGMTGGAPLDRSQNGNQLSRKALAAEMMRRGGAFSGSSYLNRGPRIKVGLAIGVASHTLNETSGRLSYRGKLMNRAARLAGVASASQVLCSLSVWEACEAADPIEFPGRVCGNFLGPMQLKGIREPLHVVHCTRGNGDWAVVSSSGPR